MPRGTLLPCKNYRFRTISFCYMYIVKQDSHLHCLNRWRRRSILVPLRIGSIKIIWKSLWKTCQILGTTGIWFLQNTGTWNQNQTNTEDSKIDSLNSIGVSKVWSILLNQTKPNQTKPIGIELQNWSIRIDGTSVGWISSLAMPAFEN